MTTLKSVKFCKFHTWFVIICLIIYFLVNDILSLEDPDTKILHHVREARTHANKHIIAKLMEQVRKVSAKKTKPKRNNCEFQKEELG